jgi:hypothetical protein
VSGWSLLQAEEAWDEAGSLEFLPRCGHIPGYSGSRAINTGVFAVSLCCGRRGSMPMLLAHMEPAQRPTRRAAIATPCARRMLQRAARVMGRCAWRGGEGLARPLPLLWCRPEGPTAAAACPSRLSVQVRNRPAGKALLSRWLEQLGSSKAETKVRRTRRGGGGRGGCKGQLPAPRGLATTQPRPAPSRVLQVNDHTVFQITDQLALNIILDNSWGPGGKVTAGGTCRQSPQRAADRGTLQA